ncbi:MAG: PIN domain nuclease, partial [Angustibacter sp.]
MSHGPLLLDTHVLLWALPDASRPSPPLAKRLKDLTAPIFVSAASGWEIATKFRMGKLPAAAPLLRHYARNLV